MIPRSAPVTLALLALVAFAGSASGQLAARSPEPDGTPSASRSREALLTLLRRHVRVERHTERLTSSLRVSYRQVEAELPLLSRQRSAWSLSLGLALGVARVISDDRRDRPPDELVPRRGPFAQPFARASLSLEYAALPLPLLRARLLVGARAGSLPSDLAPVHVTLQLEL